MFVLVRAILYAIVFGSIVLILLPARLLSWSGVTGPAAVGWQQVAGIAVCCLGALLALGCVAVFVWIGKGTPAPFDPPRRLVVRGPYEYVRNPMYIGAATAVAGVALYYQSLALLEFAIGFLVVAHLFVWFYEEPTLRRMFGEEYGSYCRRVPRWLPRSAAVARVAHAEPKTMRRG